jgi:hypothetical protein
MRSSNDQRFSDEVHKVLTAAGWFPGRSVEHDIKKSTIKLDREGGFQIFDQAKKFLDEFGGLKVRQAGAGVDIGRGSFDINPTYASGEEELFVDWSDKLGVRLYPIGEAYESRDFLAIDETGRILLLADEPRIVGENADEALDRLIRGIRMPPVVR